MQSIAVKDVMTNMTPDTESAVALLLQKVVYFENHSGISIQEIAKITGKHIRQVYYYIEGKRTPDLKFLRCLSFYMIKHYRDGRLLSLLVPEGGSILYPEHMLLQQLLEAMIELDELRSKMLHAVLGGSLPEIANQVEAMRSRATQLKRFVIDQSMDSPAQGTVQLSEEKRR